MNFNFQSKIIAPGHEDKVTRCPSQASCTFAEHSRIQDFSLYPWLIHTVHAHWKYVTVQSCQNVVITVQYRVSYKYFFYKYGFSTTINILLKNIYGVSILCSWLAFWIKSIQLFYRIQIFTCSLFLYTLLNFEHALWNDPGLEEEQIKYSYLVFSVSLFSPLSFVILVLFFLPLAGVQWLLSPDASGMRSAIAPESQEEVLTGASQPKPPNIFSWLASNNGFWRSKLKPSLREKFFDRVTTIRQMITRFLLAMKKLLDLFGQLDQRQDSFIPNGSIWALQILL